MKSPVWFLFLVYIYHYCLVVAQQSLRNISSRFPSVPHSLIPSHVVSHPDFHTIHRFFDSSPISPSNRYIATTTFSAFASSSMVYATVSIVDVQDGTTKVVDRTAAWDSQVGAQVQWGSTDNELFYNSVCQSEQAPHNVLSATQSSGQLMVRGTMYHRTSRQVKLLDCPIYHISPDGKFGIAPNMLKIHHTQKGYGIRPLDSVGSSTKNFHATPDDGLYLTNTASGHCSLLVSLHQLATVAGIDTTSTPIYGFHSKFSSDGALVMFVVRTLERPVAPRTSSVRVQHLFVLDRGAVSIRRMISWASYPFRPKTCAAHSTNTSSTTAQECPEVLLLDGNHPNWVPNSHLISMNLQKEKTIEGKVSTTAKLLQGAAKWAGLHARKREGEWNIVSIDVDAHPEDFIYRYDTDVNVMDDRILSCSRGERTCASTTEAPLPSPQAPVPQNSVLTVQIGSRAGSGHPIYHPSGKFIITDAYPKEMHALVGSEDMVVLNQSALSPLSVPLRLIEVATQREVWLLQMQVERSPVPLHRKVRKIGESLHKNVLEGLSGLLSPTTGEDKKDASSHHHTAHETSNSLNNSIVGTTTTAITAAAAAAVTTCPVPHALLQHTHSQAPLREDKSWRCDLHPAWSRDHTLVAINGRPGGAERQVVLLDLGADLSRYFPLIG